MSQNCKTTTNGICMKNRKPKRTIYKGTEAIFEAIITESSPKLSSDINHRSRELRMTPRKIDVKIYTSTYHIYTSQNQR